MRRLLLALLLALPLAAPAAELSVRAVPAQVVLGRDERVRIEVEAAQPELGPVRGVASTGTLVQEGPLAFVWTPPEARHPHTALLLLVQERPGALPPEVARLRLPLVGRTTLEVQTEPGASVTVEVGRGRFGPVLASRRGTARLMVEVPPGVRAATVIATTGQRETHRSLPLDAPPDLPVVAHVFPTPLPPEGGWLVAAGGAEPGALVVDVEGARAVPLTGSEGVWRLQPADGVRQVRGAVRIAGTEAAAAFEVPLAPPAPPPPPARSAPALTVHALTGGFFAGGSNAGVSVATGVGLGLAALDPRWALDLELGLRVAVLERSADGTGAASQLLGLPVSLALRRTLLERGRLTLAARLGGSALPLRHEFSTSTLLVSFTETSMSLEAFGAAQLAWRGTRLEGLLELRGGWAPVHTPHLRAQLGGAHLLAGVRFLP